MVELDAKTSIGTRVTNGEKVGTITGFGDGIHERAFHVYVKWDDSEDGMDSYIMNVRLNHYP